MKASKKREIFFFFFCIDVMNLFFLIGSHLTACEVNSECIHLMFKGNETEETPVV